MSHDCSRLYCQQTIESTQPNHGHASGYPGVVTYTLLDQLGFKLPFKEPGCPNTPSSFHNIDVAAGRAWHARLSSTVLPATRGARLGIPRKAV